MRKTLVVFFLAFCAACTSPQKQIKAKQDDWKNWNILSISIERDVKRNSSESITIFKGGDRLFYQIREANSDTLKKKHEKESLTKEQRDSIFLRCLLNNYKSNN